MSDFNARGPLAIGLPCHWSSVGIPTVEIANERDLRRLRGVAEKAGAMKVLFGRVLRKRPSELEVIKHNVSFLCLVHVFGLGSHHQRLRHSPCQGCWTGLKFLRW